MFRYMVDNFANYIRATRKEDGWTKERWWTSIREYLRNETGKNPPAKIWHTVNRCVQSRKREMQAEYMASGAAIELSDYKQAVDDWIIKDDDLKQFLDSKRAAGEAAKEEKHKAREADRAATRALAERKRREANRQREFMLTRMSKRQRSTDETEDSGYGAGDGERRFGRDDAGKRSPPDAKSRN